MRTNLKTLNIYVNLLLCLKAELEQINIKNFKELRLLDSKIWLNHTSFNHVCLQESIASKKSLIKKENRPIHLSRRFNLKSTDFNHGMQMLYPDSDISYW